VQHYEVVLTEEALGDLMRLQAVAIERALSSHTPDLDVVERQRDAIDHALKLIAFSPLSCRKAARAANPRQRELVIPFGQTGLIAAFETRGNTVHVGAMRHQLEQDLRR
jgi:hypothetical protein